MATRVSVLINSQPSIAYYAAVSGIKLVDDGEFERRTSVTPSSTSTTLLQRLLNDLTSHRTEVALSSLREIIDLCSEGEDETSKRRSNRWLQRLHRAGIDDRLYILSLSGNEEIEVLTRTLTGLLVGMDEEKEDENNAGGGVSGPIVKRFINGEEIIIRQQSFKEADLGWKVWSSCDVFIDLLLKSPSSHPDEEEFKIDIKGKDLLELGCGTGLLGIVCGKLGAKSIHMTDYHDSVVNNARRNAIANGMEDIITTSVLDWFRVAEAYHNLSSTSSSSSSSSSTPSTSSSSSSPSSSPSLSSLRSFYEVIIASDVIYTPKEPYIFPPLIHYLLKPSPSSVFYVVLPAETHREGIPEFETEMINNGFKMKKIPIPVDQHSGVPHAYYEFRYN